MNKFLIAIVVLIALVVGSTASILAIGKGSGGKSYSWRYKMTVEIETPEGVKTGSAVREVTILFTPNPSAQSGYDDDITMNGEAVVVDLGQHGKVFAVQRYDDFTLPFRIFPGPPGRTFEGAKFYSKLKAQGELKQEYFPILVKFENINNPLSVQLIYGSVPNETGIGLPFTFQDNFRKQYGNDIKLKRIMIEMTDEPITYKVREILPWITNYRNKLFDGKHIHTIKAENRLANSLGAGSFTTDTDTDRGEKE